MYSDGPLLLCFWRQEWYKQDGGRGCNAEATSGIVKGKDGWKGRPRPTLGKPRFYFTYIKFLIAIILPSPMSSQVTKDTETAMYTSSCASARDIGRVRDAFAPSVLANNVSTFLETLFHFQSAGQDALLLSQGAGSCWTMAADFSRTNHLSLGLLSFVLEEKDAKASKHDEDLPTRSRKPFQGLLAKHKQ
ncbi:hypothetical protein AC579_5228 [Pseudocercospora musae]|uniref:Uncharacterized protein n=1 Tax=Pseudocercospora musae TaxID=113226 RepID=A0A139IPP5_9PEZI|nr:hypothetical protein AC579_5228 [Pseudocercospora musae]